MPTTDKGLQGYNYPLWLVMGLRFSLPLEDPIVASRCLQYRSTGGDYDNLGLPNGSRWLSPINSFEVSISYGHLSRGLESNSSSEIEVRSKYGNSRVVKIISHLLADLWM